MLQRGSRVSHEGQLLARLKDALLGLPGVRDKVLTTVWTSAAGACFPISGSSMETSGSKRRRESLSSEPRAPAVLRTS